MSFSAIIRNTMRGFANRMEDFRLAYLHGQVAGSSGLDISTDQFKRVRPLNDMLCSGAVSNLSENPEHGLIDPRLLAFIAFASSLGVLTMKGLAEQQGDPLRRVATGHQVNRLKHDPAWRMVANISIDQSYLPNITPRRLKACIPVMQGRNIAASSLP